jgi:isopenicillin-N N-acyltransferase-like protein
MKPWVLSWLILTISIPLGLAEEPRSTYPAARFESGELRYVDRLPVLMLRGKPAEIGRQFGELGVKNAPDLDGFRQRFLKDLQLDRQEWLLKLMARRLRSGVPADHRVELEAACKQSGRAVDDALFANTIYDLSSGMGCSTLVVSASRSRTGKPLFGRNFDWHPTRGITEHTLLLLIQPEGKHAIALVTVAPIVGCISGINDAGLTVALNEVQLRKSNDRSEFNWNGTPMMLAFRRVLEECRTVAEAERLLRSLPRTTAACVTLCDADTSAVLELTPKTVLRRAPVAGICCCTNHFCSEELRLPGTCKRLPKLQGLQKTEDLLGVAEVFTQLDQVHQGQATLQSMVFEPVDRILHLKYGDGPATQKQAISIRLSELWKEAVVPNAGRKSSPTP